MSDKNIPSTSKVKALLCSEQIENNNKVSLNIIRHSISFYFSITFHFSKTMQRGATSNTFPVDTSSTIATVV